MNEINGRKEKRKEMKELEKVEDRATFLQLD